ncbi:hypothetical protein DBR06_SOUSAS5310084, partial [Sousa chinensis]
MFVGGKAERPSMAGGQGRGATKQVLGAEEREREKRGFCNSPGAAFDSGSSGAVSNLCQDAAKQLQEHERGGAAETLARAPAHRGKPGSLELWLPGPPTAIQQAKEIPEVLVEPRGRRCCLPGRFLGEGSALRSL